MDSNRIMLANSIFFVAIVGLAVWIIQEERQLPMRPPLEMITSGAEAQAGPADPRANEFASLGRKAMFDTIISIPPPPPTPVPTPVPPPPIDKVVQYWKMQGVLDGMAFFYNVKDNADFILNLKDDTRRKQVEFGGKNYTIELESASLREFKCVIKMEADGEVQRKTFDGQSQ